MDFKVLRQRVAVDMTLEEPETNGVIMLLEAEEVETRCVGMKHCWKQVVPL